MLIVIIGLGWTDVSKLIDLCLTDVINYKVS